MTKNRLKTLNKKTLALICFTCWLMHNAVGPRFSIDGSKSEEKIYSILIQACGHKTII